jgi:hypothetical protein
MLNLKRVSPWFVLLMHVNLIEVNDLVKIGWVYWWRVDKK